MLQVACLNICILSFWHAGSGMGRGADSDALVLKNDQGLPYLPGRTVKGLLREGVQTGEEVGQIKPGRTFSLFGRPSKPGDPSGSSPGCLRFESAQLPDEERLWLSSSEGMDFKDALFIPFSSTSLSEKGLALDQTLRTIELTIPLTLQALVKGPDETDWIQDLSIGCAFVRSLGSHRNRGLGRCLWTIQEEVIRDA